MPVPKPPIAVIRYGCCFFLCVLLAGCAGGGSSSSPAVSAPVAVPAQLTITTSGALAAGTFGQFYKTTLQASGGTPPYQWFAVDGDPLGAAGLTLNMNSGELSGVLTNQLQFSAGVQDAKRHGAIARITVPLNFSSVKIVTSVLPPATVNHPYDVVIQCNQPGSGCASPLQVSSLPPGLSNNNSDLRGIPTTAGSFTFTITAATSADQRTFTLLVSDKQPRNDALSSATALSNGRWSVSISPYHDSSSNGPDEDFYALSAPGGSYVSVNIFAERNGSPLDSVLEIVDQNGQRFRTCSDAGISTAFTNPCMNDDIIPEFTLDSMLTFKVPGTGSQKFFVHVLDWRGDARPDMLYQMSIIGAD